MKKSLMIVFGILFMGMCISAYGSDNVSIIGKWTAISIDESHKVIQEYKKNGRMDFMSYHNGKPQMKRPLRYKYKISGNELTWNFFGVKTIHKIDLSIPGVLKFVDFGNSKNANLYYFNFDNIPASNEMVIKGQWIRDDKEGSSSLWDFKTNKDLHI